MKPNEISQRDFDSWNRCASPESPEATMGEEFDLVETSRLLDTLAAKSRLADLGERSSSLAHELRQPLFSISVANENLRMMLGRSDISRCQLDRAIERIAEQVSRAQTIIDRTLAYASGRGVGTADMAAAALHATEFLQPLLEAAGIDVSGCEADGPVVVEMCQVEAEQIFVNVLRNAMESIEARREAGWQGAGRIAIGFEVLRGTLRCTVSDNGAGLTGAAQNLVFEPFFTTKAVGTGLGLRICREALARAGGTMRLVPVEHEGARVEIELPLVA